jgi:prevent-host-death family protein
LSPLLSSGLDPILGEILDTAGRAAGRDPAEPCREVRDANLVGMTRMVKAIRHIEAAPKSEPQPPNPRSGYWVLQDAKARFSELVRRVRSEGPQHVTVHGRDEVVVVAAEEFRRMRGEQTGAALIEAMQASPYREIDFEPQRFPMPVRDVDLT